MRNPIHVALPVVLCATSALAQSPNPLVVFTEESSTVLTVTVGGVAYGTVNNVAPNSWGWTPPLSKSVDLLEVNTSTEWLEPEATPGRMLGNSVIPVADLRFLFKVFSDFDFTGVIGPSGFPEPSVPDGTILRDYLVIGFTDSTSQGYDVQFFDRGDAAGVPDQSRTLPLLLLSVVALACVRLKQPFNCSERLV
jgi:hypothetical protein